jgi:predicted nucleic acid-binding protein
VSFLLDTNVISEMTRKRPSPRVQTWLESRGAETLFLSVITVGELRKGALLAEAAKRKRLLDWIEHVLKPQFSGHILPLDVGTLEKWADIQAALQRRGKSVPVLDGFIAATATAHDLTVVTRNVTDFRLVNVRVLNPW